MSSTAAWMPSVTVEDVVARIAGARNIVAVTHSKPDGDAAGSTLAVVRAINRRGSGRAAAWFVGPMPHWIGEIAGSTPMRTFKGGEAAGSPEDPELVLVLDTGSWSQLRELADWIRARKDRVIVIDHHLHGDADVSDARLIETTAPATAQIAAAVACGVLGVDSASRLPADVAEPLYLGMATDTGWFRHENVTPVALRLAADLMQAGASHTRLYQVVEQQDPPSRLKLMARALASAELHAGATISTMALRRADFAAAGAERNDSTGFVEVPLAVGSVRVSAVLTEEAPENGGTRPVTKISLRSKPGPNAVDVNEVASRLGGGGHARASGARVNLAIDEAKSALLAALGAR